MPKSDRFTLECMQNNYNKAQGDKTVMVGTAMRRDPQRLPTGIFAVDYVIGGGLPLWGTTCFWGPDAGGKTNMAISATAVAQRMCWRCFQMADNCVCKKSPLIMKVFWADAEGTLDSKWASDIGVDMNNIYVGHGDYGEAYINMAESAIQAEDCGLVIIDSLAALIPETELTAPMEDNFVATQARMVSRGIRKMKQRLVQERKKGHSVTLLITNQMRHKIGQMFGNPETMPGGFAMKHEFSLLLRCVSKAMKKEGVDAKFIDTARKKNTAQRFAFSVRKTKVLTLAGVGEYVRVTEPMPEIGLAKGQISDHVTVYNLAREHELIKKVSKGYEVDGSVFAKVEDIKNHWKTNFSDYMKVQHAVIQAAKELLYAE